MNAYYDKLSLNELLCLRATFKLLLLRGSGDSYTERGVIFFDSLISQRITKQKAEENNMEIPQGTLRWSHKPYDIVTNNDGDVGFIQEVSFTQGRPDYAVQWLIGNDKHAWWSHDELKVHCNMFVKIAEVSCHPMGHNDRDVKHLFNNFQLYDKTKQRKQ